MAVSISKEWEPNQKGCMIAKQLILLLNEVFFFSFAFSSPGNPGFSTQS